MPTDAGHDIPGPVIPQPDVAQAPEAAAEKPGLVTTSAARAIDSVLKDKAISVWGEVDLWAFGPGSTFFSFFDAGQAAKFDKAAGAFAAWYSKALEAHENLYQNPEGDRLAAELRALEPRFKGRFPSRIYGDGHWITEPQKLLDAEFYAKQMEAPSHEDDEAAEAAGWAAYYAEIDANEEALRRLEEAREEDDEDRDEGAPSNSMGYEAAPFGEEDDEREAMAEITGDKAWIVAVGDRALKIAEGDGRKFPEGPDFTTARLDLRDILPQSEKDELDRELRAVEEGRPAGSN
jgi:hypothetical protein